MDIELALILKFKGPSFDISASYFMSGDADAAADSFKAAEVRKLLTMETILSGRQDIDRYLHKHFPGHLDWSVLYGLLRYRIPSHRRNDYYLLSIVSPSFQQGSQYMCAYPLSI